MVVEQTKNFSGKVIVQILPSLERGGGVERGTLEIARAVIDAGGEAIVISNGGLLVSQLKRMGGRHFALPVHSKNPFRWFFIRLKLARVLAESKVNLVHIRSRAPAWMALSLSRWFGAKVVTTMHGRLYEQNWFKRFYTRIMIKSDRVIAISHYSKKRILEVFPRAEDRIEVIHRGVDLDIFSPDMVSPQRVVSLANMFGVPDDKRVIMLPARPTSWKGAEMLIEAVTLLSGEGEDDFIVLLIGAASGSPRFQQNLVRLIERSGLEGKVWLCPLIDDMAAALMLADVVVMPSVTPEPFGRVAIEASAMGCPVVAFDHGGASETIIDGKTGFLAQPTSRASLAQCLAQALALKAKQRRELASAARALVEANFTTAQMCAKTLAIYAKLLRIRSKLD